MNARKLFELVMYADDSTLSTTLNSLNINVNSDNIDNVNSELAKLQIGLNLTNCHLMHPRQSS